MSVVIESLQWLISIEEVKKVYMKWSQEATRTRSSQGGVYPHLRDGKSGSMIKPCFRAQETKETSCYFYQASITLKSTPDKDKKWADTHMQECMHTHENHRLRTLRKTEVKTLNKMVNGSQRHRKKGSHFTYEFPCWKSGVGSHVGAGQGGSLPMRVDPQGLERREAQCRARREGMTQPWSLGSVPKPSGCVPRSRGSRVTHGCTCSQEVEMTLKTRWF